MLESLREYFDITLVCFSGQFERDPDEDIICGDVRRITVPYSKAGYYFLSPSLYRAARRAIKESAPDVILADADKTGLYAWWVGRQSGIPFVYSSHNVEYRRFLDLGRTSPLRLLLVPWMLLVEYITVRRAAASIAISESDAEQFRRLVPGARIHALPMAYDEQQFFAEEFSPVSKSPVVLMVGNYAYAPNRQGAEAMLQTVIPEVARQVPNVVFRFVGRGFPPALQHPNLEAPGLVQDLAAEYRAASVVVNPIEAGGGIKIKAIEALACGKFLISTPGGMNGIGHEGMDMVSVGPLHAFPQMIVTALRHGRAATVANQARVQSAFGARSQARRLAGILTGAIRQALTARRTQRASAPSA
jgi:glycosyltransferase involved in cell wall biosynthesis